MKRVFHSFLTPIFNYASNACEQSVFLGKNVPIIETEIIGKDDSPQSTHPTEIYKIVLDAGKEWGESFHPGQFVQIRCREGNERIPLAITHFDDETGYLTLVYKASGASTLKLARLEPGDFVEDLSYPLGKPMNVKEAEKGKYSLVVAGGVGIAPALAKTKELHKHGHDVKVILSARNKDLLILQKEVYESIGLKIGEENDKVFITTDDGSYNGPDCVGYGDISKESNRSLFGVDVLKQIVNYAGKEGIGDRGELIHERTKKSISNTIDKNDISEIFVIGPLDMMESVANAAEVFDVPTYASLNTVMIDGSGMCGGCMAKINGEEFYTCVDGPIAPIEGLNWSEMKTRGRIYDNYESLSKDLLSLTDNGENIESIVLEDLNLISPENYIEKLAERFGMKVTDSVKDIVANVEDQFQHPGFISLESAVMSCASMCTCGKKPKTKPCQKKCPVHNNIQGFIAPLKPENVMKAMNLSEGDEDKLVECLRKVESDPLKYAECTEIIDHQIYKSYCVVRETNPIPEITGLVCPQEDQCQMNCATIYRKEHGSTPIGKIEAFIANWIRINNKRIKQYSWYQREKPKEIVESGKKVMVVGSGPAGIVVAAELRKKGHDVTVYETLHEPGGVLIYGIPEFRLPKEIVRYEIEQIAEMGVKFLLNHKIDDLERHMKEKGFDAAFVGSGAGNPIYLTNDKNETVPGQRLVGVYSANEFLQRTNLMKSYKFPFVDTPPPDVVNKKVVVLGGGNVAMDSARCALRLGAKEVNIMYRRGRDELPARLDEISHAELEGASFQFLKAPLELIGENGKLEKIKYQLMELGESEGKKKRRPIIPIEGEIHEMDADVAIIAIGQGPNTIMKMDNFETVKGRIVVDQDTMETNIEGVFAGGDIIHENNGTVIFAAGCGLTASESIDEYLQKL